MLLRLHARAALSGALFLAVAACNAVLDNHPGILEESSSDGTEPAAAGDAGKKPPSGSATATAEPGHDASTDFSPTTPPEAAPPAPACAAGWADCNANPSDGCEADLATNVTSCGACGVVCPGVEMPNTLPTCVNGVCERTCAEGFADCNGKPADGCEANLRKDKRHCGQCGTFCFFGKCVDGQCAM